MKIQIRGFDHVLFFTPGKSMKEIKAENAEKGDLGIVAEVSIIVTIYEHMTVASLLSIGHRKSVMC